MKEPEITPADFVFDPKEQNIKIAKNQPQYRVLPALILDKNTSVTRWRIPASHRLRILLTGNLYVETMTFGKYEWREKQTEPVYPQYLYTQVNWLIKVVKYFDRLGEKYKLLGN